MYKYCNPINSPMMRGGMLMWIIGIIVVIAVIYIVTKVNNKTTTPKSSSTAIRILEERYAKGEIDEVEFESKRRHLEGK